MCPGGTFLGKAFASRLHPGQLLTWLGDLEGIGDGYRSQLPGNKTALFPEFLWVSGQRLGGQEVYSAQPVLCKC